MGFGLIEDISVSLKSRCFKSVAFCTSLFKVVFLVNWNCVESGGLKGVTLNNTMINGLCKIEMVDEVMNLRKKCIPKIWFLMPRNSSESPIVEKRALISQTKRYISFYKELMMILCKIWARSATPLRKLWALSISFTTLPSPPWTLSFKCHCNFYRSLS